MISYKELLKENQELKDEKIILLKEITELLNDKSKLLQENFELKKEKHRDEIKKIFENLNKYLNGEIKI